MSFKELKLHPKILKAIAEIGYTSPTPIQKEVIPKIQSGVDLCASAQTGTGKTATFLLPAIDRLITPSEQSGKGPRVLVLVPTRELAMQVAEEATKYSKYLSPMKTVCINGGSPYPIQNRQLARPHEILVATPGRLIDHIQRGNINFNRLELFVLDEADRMLDMGFIQAVEEIAKAIPTQPQTLLFSATLGKNVLTLTQKLLKDPEKITLSPEKPQHENIEQNFYHVGNLTDKYKALDHLLSTLDIHQAVIFTATKRHADELLDILLEQGHEAAALHGDMNQRQRTRTIGRLREGKVQLLVATDVAARGIDINTINHVINFDLPNMVDDYVHRIGRTGRAKAKGCASSLVAPKDIPLLKNIQKMIDEQIDIQTIPGIEPRRPRPTGSKAGSGRGDRAGSPKTRSSSRPRTGSTFPSRHSNSSGNGGGYGYGNNENRPRRDFRKKQPARAETGRRGSAP